MEINKYFPPNFGANCYVLTADGKTAVVIDPSSPLITEFLKKKNLVCEYVLLTHGHFDHILGCAALSAVGAKICCSEREKDFIFSEPNLNICPQLEIPYFEISRTFADGEKVNLCGINFTVLSTAGHTAGDVCYIAENYIFTGDTLFCENVGRTDLPTGNFKALMESVKKLFALDGDYTVLCGHGEDTNLSREREFNPYAGY